MAWQKPTSLNDWAGIVLRHKKKFFFPAVMVMIIVIVASLWIPREYKAEGKFQRINDPAMFQLGKGDSVNMQNLDYLRRQLYEDMRGRSAVEQLVSDLHMDRDLPHTSDNQLTKEGQLQMYDLVRSMRDRLTVYFQDSYEHADLIVVTFNAEDAELASKVVNQAMENYIRKTSQALDEMLINSKTFFEREVTRYNGKVRELESKKLRFELDNPGLDPNDPQSARTRLVELRSKLYTINQYIDVAKGKLGKLQQFVKDQPEFVSTQEEGENPDLTRLREEMAMLQDEYTQHKKLGRKDAHPAVAKNLAMQAALKTKIEEMHDTVVQKTVHSPNIQRLVAMQEIETLKGEIEPLEHQRDILTQQVEQYEIMDRNFFVVRNEYLQIQRELDDGVQQLQFWDANLRRTQTALSVAVGQRGIRLSITQRAPDYAKPSKPTVWGILSMAIMLGLGTGVGLVVLAELLDSSFHSIDQAVDSLKLPVLGSVNQIITPAQVFRHRVLSWGVFPATGAVLTVVLLFSSALAYLSLTDPPRFERIVHNIGGDWARSNLLKS
ncbi:MAG: hypothetical protein WD042_01105 [Phycisphaeraceae bacterium]